MKFSKVTAVLALSALLAFDATAASFGRSGGSSFSSSSSRSYSAPSRSYSAPSPSYTAPKAAPSPSSAGIGGTSGSMGVRKADVTAPVAAKVDANRAATGVAPSSTSSYAANRPTPAAPVAAAPSYAPAAPSYAAPMAQSSGPGFGTIFGGALAGTVVGNMLNGNHNGGGTTVVNGGGGSAPGVVAAGSAPAQYDQAGQAIMPTTVVATKSYGIGSFIADVLLFALLVAVLALLAYLAYKGYKMARNFVNQERGIGEAQPFAPTGHFWEVQKAFATADLEKLKTLLGPDLVDEATANLEPVTINLSRVSHEIVRNTPREFSVHYSFFDNGENVNQVWHYEKFGANWLLNGIETV